MPSKEAPPKSRRAVLVGVAGSNTAFSLSLYNLKAYAFTDARIGRTWDLAVMQEPLIGLAEQSRRLPKLAEAIIARDPELVCFSCYMWNAAVFRDLARLLRERLPGARLAWGGPEMATDSIREGKYDGLEADYCVSGEGELTFLELMRHLTDGKPALAEIDGLSYRERGGGPFKINAKREPFPSLLEIPSPFLAGVVDDEVLFRRSVQANIETQRGCNLRCSYCIYHKDMSEISYSSVERTIAEVRYCVDRGVRHVRFVDANFGSDLDHAKAVMRGLIRERFETKLMFELIPGFIDDELARLFGEFNSLCDWNEVTLGVGVQTINLEVLRKIRRAIRIERFEETFALLQKYGLFAKIDLIIGMPGEDLASIERTLEYMLDKMRGSRHHLLCCHVMRGLPGTELLEIAKEYDMVFSSEHEPHELVSSPALPRADMLKCLRRTAVVFRLINHGGWSSRELLTGKCSDETTVREAFFSAADRLGVSLVAVVDRVVAGLMEELKPRNSRFTQPEFPYAETWWWNASPLEVTNEWLVRFLAELA
jgi:radical SAM superfamily enzyme YgiQ (UPF0313 family)